MTPFTVFGQPGCGYCVRAKQLLELRGLPCKYVDILAEGISPIDLAETIGRPVRSVPQIFHGKEYIGGFTELNQYLQRIQAA